MKVRELLDILNALPDDLEVVLQKDSEGNGYSPASGCCLGQYTPDSTWSGEFRQEDDDPEYYKDEPFTANAVCLWPVN